MLYCDTSALLKLYIEEAHSNRLKSRVAEADAVLRSILQQLGV